MASRNGIGKGAQDMRRLMGMAGAQPLMGTPRAGLKPNTGRAAAPVAVMKRKMGRGG